MKPLTPKEQKVLQFIQIYSDKRGMPPTYAEIQDKFEYKAISSVQQYIGQLVKKGHLKAPIGESKKRAIEIVADSPFVSIPLEGYVQAGRLTEAIQNREYIEVTPDLVKSSQDMFALKVRGDSMIGDCIMDGDLVIVKRQATARNNQTVIAMVDGDATLKRYFKKPTHIELHPANPDFAIIHVAPTANFQILGIVTNVIRKLV
jgi:repressor LexA